MEPWELILHHAYAGTPGVIFDHSPGHRGHGVAVGLDRRDFELDGLVNGSGAVRFSRDQPKKITVTPPGGWERVGGMRAQMTFKTELPNASGRLFSGENQFFCGIFNGTTIDFGIKIASGALLRFPVHLDEIGVDPRSWTTAQVEYDGLTTVRWSVNGIEKTWLDRPLAAIAPIATLTIGNEPGGSLGFEGLIDELKIWRPNPAKITSDFTDRIVKAGLTDCWAQWGRKFRAVLDDLAARDPECLPRIARLIDDIAPRVLNPGLARSAAARQALQQAFSDYRRSWSHGNLDAIGPILAHLRNALHDKGIDIEGSPEFRALAANECFQVLLRTAPPLDCDPAFTGMLRGGGA